MNLYQLSAEFKQLEALMEEAEAEGGLCSSALLSECMGAVEADIEKKADAIVRVIQNEEAREEALANEIRTLQEKKGSAQNRQKWLREYLRDFIKALGKDKLETPIRKLSLKKPSKSLEVDISKILDWPAETFDAAVKIGAVVEKYEVKKPLLKGIPNYLELPGVKEVEGEESLMIR